MKFDRGLPDNSSYRKVLERRTLLAGREISNGMVEVNARATGSERSGWRDGRV